MKQRARKPALSKAELFLLLNISRLFDRRVAKKSGAKFFCRGIASFFLFDKKLLFTVKTAVYVVGKKC